MSAEHATSYTADGPTEIGFRTGGDGTGIKKGVVVSGTKIGVHGIARDPGSIDPIGVVGEGHIGVQGLGRQPENTGPSSSVGVFGQGFAGVRGAGEGADGIGVDGGSKATGVRGNGDLVGVRGESNVRGVIGVSGKGGTGVEGSNSDSGTGVEGNSDSGVGVIGRSTHGVAGFFNSVDKEALVGLSGGPGNGVRGGAGSGSGVRGTADSGSGVSGESTSGVGVFGDSEKQSGVVGRSRSAVAPGVFGVCEKLTGVAGRSTDAPGVFGDSVKQAGVMGRSFDTSAPGVFGFGDAPFKVLGPPAGVLGLNDNSVGVLGSSGKVIGILGNTDKGLGVVGVANFGAGVPTDQITDQGIAVIGLGNSGFGAAGLSTSGTGIFGSSKTGLAGHFKGPVMIEGDVTIVGGTKSAAVPHPDGSHRQLYCLESPESWFEDFGEARLVNGKAEVRLDRGFAALVKLKGYHVFLTPYGDCKGMFVTKRAATGFRVCEQQGGTSNVRFAYRVVAKRKDVVARRLAKVTLPKVSKRLQLPNLKLKIKLPDFKRLSVTPFDLPGTLSKRKKPLGPTKRGNVKAPAIIGKKNKAKKERKGQSGLALIRRTVSKG